MKPAIKEYPFYIKSTVVLLGLTLFCIALFTLKEIVAPIAFSMIIAILLNPLVNKLQNKGVNKIVAISLSLTLAFILVAGILYFISSQVMNFGDNLPALKVKFNEHLGQLQQWLSSNFNVSIEKQQQALNDALNNSKALLGSAVGGLLGTIGLIVLIPIYVFLLLFYKTLIINFFHEIFAEENTAKVSEVLGETKSAIQSYMVGLLLEALVVAVLNSVALLLLGVEYAILLGVIGALLNMLPYIGGIIAIALPVIISAVTKDGFTTPLLIVGAYTLIQFIDNNFLVPFLVSSRVKINAFFSVVVVLLGGALWGVAGMFLSIPFVAILKIIFDRLPEMKPWGKLLGDEVPTRHKGEVWMRRQQRKLEKSSVAEKIVESSEKK
ncbi:AI-2E family transporter [Ferruginibacter sp. HRS2-29]|uniref:AI-2E family transporter n=1 Tax=Ferruginibacter sp. HRS2-29 TaxID=2487334 RepID=UPI0020CF8FB5|nr:AI-2E family transporter [Ferruginibacter sp. HRS2-29]MCP9752145.1 AI-2E family transporter [Ferruginibacter sp. HRS2-29]